MYQYVLFTSQSINWVRNAQNLTKFFQIQFQTQFLFTQSAVHLRQFWAQMPLYFYTQLSLSLSVSWLSKPNPTVQLLDEMAPPSILFIAQWSDGTENWIRWIEFLKKIHKIRVLITSWKVMKYFCCQMMNFFHNHNVLEHEKKLKKIGRGTIICISDSPLSRYIN
jgi:hypothetical protein